jgi:uncharacterized protein with NRDE domain
MCTLTYLPLENDQFIITTNRDESVLRKMALPPHILQHQRGRILCPIDGKARGTWIATAESGVTACLLNGAFEKHIPNGPYRMSRGKVVLEVFDYEDIDTFFEVCNLDNIEPFTLVLVENKQNLKLTELRWDGRRKYIQKLEAGIPHLWASATLYPPEVIASRRQWFASWLAKSPAFTRENIVNFHKSAGEGDLENDLVMQRGTQLRTVSITSVVGGAHAAEMYYEDLLNHQKVTQRLSFHTSQTLKQES